MNMTPVEIPDFMPAPEPAPMNAAARVANVFFSPGKAFADIARRPSWWVPVVLAMVLTTTYLYMFSQRVGWEFFFRQQNAQSVQMQQLDAATRARTEALQVLIGTYLTWGAGLVGPLIGALLMAGILKFMADTILGAGIGFKKTLAAVTYGTLPNLLKTCLAMIVLQIKPPDEFDLQNPVMVNGAVFLPANAAAWMKTLGSSLDLFTIWCMVLIAIGIAAGAKRMSAGKAFAMMLFPWALWVILATAYAAVART